MHTTARRMRKSSMVNFRSMAYRIVSLRRNMTMKTAMSSHVAIVMALDLSSRTISVYRAARDIEGIIIGNVKCNNPRPPNLTQKERREKQQVKGRKGLRSGGCSRQDHVGRVGSANPTDEIEGSLGVRGKECYEEEKRSNRSCHSLAYHSPWPR